MGKANPPTLKINSTVALALPPGFKGCFFLHKNIGSKTPIWGRFLFGLPVSGSCWAKSMWMCFCWCSMWPPWTCFYHCKVFGGLGGWIWTVVLTVGVFCCPVGPECPIFEKGRTRVRWKEKQYSWKFISFVFFFEGILAKDFCRGCKFFGSHGLIRDVEIYVSWVGCNEYSTELLE